MFDIIPRVVMMLLIITSLIIVQKIDRAVGTKYSFQAGRKNAKTEPTAVPLESAPISWIYDALPEQLLNGNTDYIAHAAEVLLRRLSSMRSNDIPQASLRVHSQRYDDWSKLDPACFRALCSPAEYCTLLYIGSFHVNGRYREACVHRMAEFPRALPFLLLRCSDWVPAVRKAAASHASELIPACSPLFLAGTIPCLHRLLKSERCFDSGAQPVLTDAILARICEAPTVIPQQTPHTRRLTYALLVERDAMTPALFDILASFEEDAFLHRFLLCHYIAADLAEDAQLAAWLSDDAPAVRLAAARKRYEKSGFCDGFAELLMDESRSMREFAAFCLYKYRAFDIAAFYRERLTAECPLAVIYGLGEYGSEADVPLLQPFLKGASHRRICAALTAIHTIRGADCAELLWEHLFHATPAVAKTAYRLIAASGSHYGAGIRYGAERIYNAIPGQPPATRRRLIRLLTKEDFWERLPYLLALYEMPAFDYDDLTEYTQNDPEGAAEFRMQTAVLNAICTPPPFTCVKPALAAQIREAAEQTKLPEELKAKLLSVVEHAVIASV